MSSLPAWIQYLQALATPAIALLAIVIGMIQWRTAHQRAVLDLFDRRMGTYEALNAAISMIMRDGRATVEVLAAFDRAFVKAPFLFGEEVTDFLEETRQRIVVLNMAGKMANTDDDAIRAKYADAEAEHLLELTSFFKNFANLIQPYVKMHQKAPPF